MRKRPIRINGPVDLLVVHVKVVCMWVISPLHCLIPTHLMSPRQKWVLLDFLFQGQLP